MPFRLLDPSTAVAAPVVTFGAPLTSVGETLGSLRAELLLQLSSRSDVDTPRLNRWINWAYRSLAGMLKLNELKASMTFATVSGQPFYMLPVQVRSVKGISIKLPGSASYKGGVNLTMMTEDEYYREPDLPASATTSWPTSYFRFGRMLVVWPDPAAVYSLYHRVVIRPDDLVNDTDSPILPKEFHEPLLLYARYKAWRSLRNLPEANLAKNDFISELRPLIDTDAEETEEQPRGLTVARRASDLTRSRR